MKKRCNIEIRSLILMNGLSFKDVYTEMGILQASFSRLMREELSQRKREEVMEAIKRCVSKKQEGKLYER